MRSVVDTNDLMDLNRLDKGADACLQDSDGLTALHKAASRVSRSHYQARLPRAFVALRVMLLHILALLYWQSHVRAPHPLMPRMKSYTALITHESHKEI